MGRASNRRHSSTVAAGERRVCSFPPVVGSAPRVLILGSMPGKVSLAEYQYYAHPQNRFWTIMGELVGAGPELPYEQRLEVLKERRIALWDSLQSCVRETSLDSDIDDSTVVPNAIVDLLRAEPTIERVFFNGHKSEQVFNRRLRAEADRIDREIAYMRLPSTSPKHASVAYEEKLRRWRAVVEQ